MQVYLEAFFKIYFINLVVVLIYVDLIIGSNLINALNPNNWFLLLSLYYDPKIISPEVLCIIIVPAHVLLNIITFNIITKQMKRKSSSINKKSYTIALILLIATASILYISTFITVETTYPQLIETLRNSPIVKNCSKQSIEDLWNFVKWYYHSYRGNLGFIVTYKKPWPKPRQLFISFDKFTINEKFVFKLAAITATGACEDFALAITRLIKDVYSYNTRIVLGVNHHWDHAIPEVEVNGTWYIIDISFTTPEKYVKADEYAEHLQYLSYRHSIISQIYNNIINGRTKLVDRNTGQNLTSEHGFKVDNSTQSNTEAISNGTCVINCYNMFEKEGFLYI